MKVAYLTSGAAGMFCGSCMHDNTLASALIKKGCDIQLIPTYTPIRTDEGDVSSDQIFFGGINIYLQQKIPFFRYLPRALDRWLDNPRLIQMLAARSIKTDPSDLGNLTISMLKGESGFQRKEVKRLVDWLENESKPDLVVFSNILIGGCIPTIKKALKVPVLVTLQGDDLCIDFLPDPFRTTVKDLIKKLLNQVDGFIVPCEDYAEYMGEYLGIPPEKFHLVPLGLNLDDFSMAPALEKPPADDKTSSGQTIGYLARISPEKGFHRLVDAFIQLKNMKGTEKACLKVAGWLGASNREYFNQQKARLDKAGYAGDFIFEENINRFAKMQFLSSLDVFSVPTTYREPKGRYILEAMAASIPVIQPNHGAFPDIIRNTGGGCLFDPEDQNEPAKSIHHLLTHDKERKDRGRRAREKVFSLYSAESMADSALSVYRQFIKNWTN